MYENNKGDEGWFIGEFLFCFVCLLVDCFLKILFFNFKWKWDYNIYWCKMVKEGNLFKEKGVKIKGLKIYFCFLNFFLKL